MIISLAGLNAHRSHEGPDVGGSAPRTRRGRAVGAERGAEEDVLVEEFGDDDATLGVEQVVLR